MENPKLMKFFRFLLYIAIGSSLAQVVWERVNDGLAVADNPVFQTCLLFVILLAVVELYYKKAN